MVLILKENDLGTTLLIGATSVAIMFIAGSNPIYMGGMAVAGAGGILYLAMHMSERMARLTAFLDLEKYKERAGLQQWESLKAFGSGGLFGRGLGESVEKMLYLPYAHTDFIFPIIGEELGLRVTLLVVLRVPGADPERHRHRLQSRDRFGMLLGFGLVINIGLQACVNIGMTTALLPNKGMPLPFISYGGSNLCLCLLFTGHPLEHLPPRATRRDQPGHAGGRSPGPRRRPGSDRSPRRRGWGLHFAPRPSKVGLESL